jgi:hypothetical protein
MMKKKSSKKSPSPRSVLLAAEQLLVKHPSAERLDAKRAKTESNQAVKSRADAPSKWT